jgi:hypothetical protein
VADLDVVEICAGAGGQALGLERANAEQMASPGLGGVVLDARPESIQTMLAEGQRPPGGQLLGISELGSDVWPTWRGTLSGWLNCQRPKRCPFPGAAREPIPRVLAGVLSAGVAPGVLERVVQGTTERLQAWIRPSRAMPVLACALCCPGRPATMTPRTGSAWNVASDTKTCT